MPNYRQVTAQRTYYTLYIKDYFPHIILLLFWLTFWLDFQVYYSKVEVISQIINVSNCEVVFLNVVSFLVITHTRMLSFLLSKHIQVTINATNKPTFSFFQRIQIPLHRYFYDTCNIERSPFNRVHRNKKLLRSRRSSDINFYVFYTRLQNY